MDIIPAGEPIPQHGEATLQLFRLTNNLASDPQKEREISDIMAADTARLKGWLEEIGHVPRLDLPSSALRGLITRRMLDIVKKPGNVDVRINPNKNRNVLDFMIVTESPTPVTDVEKFKNLLEHGIKENTPCPSYIDPLLWNMGTADFVSNGILKPTDVPILKASLEKFGPDNAADLVVVDLVIPKELQRRGIGTSFYQDALRPFASQSGFLDIVGQNSQGGEDDSQRNIDFFTERLGRKRFTDLQPETQARLRRNIGYLDFDNVTVDDLSQSPTNK